ncbi:MAG: hypothetical protein ACTS73_04030 [Arsenophonus sp. NEOnobi-MAG3]
MARFSANYPAEIKKLEKVREELLAFYDFSSAHCVSIRMINPIESAFAI